MFKAIWLTMARAALHGASKKLIRLARNRAVVTSFLIVIVTICSMCWAQQPPSAGSGQAPPSGSGQAPSTGAGQPPAGQPQGDQGGGGGMGALIGTFVVPMLFFFVVMYFIVIRPQKKQQKEKENMINEMKKDDEVLTTSGIYARVDKVNEQDVILKIDKAGEIKVRFHKSAILAVTTKGDKPAADGSASSSEKTGAEK